MHVLRQLLENPLTLLPASWQARRLDRDQSIPIGPVRGLNAVRAHGPLSPDTLRGQSSAPVKDDHRPSGVKRRTSIT
jgi:hypothetical protein